MRASRLIELLCLLVPKRIPVLVTGKQGGGKTEIWRLVAQMLDYAFVVWHPVTQEPVDFKGYPFMVEGTKGKKRAEFAMFGDLEAVVNAKRKTLCLIDDIGHASPSMQAATMHPIRARHINQHQVSDLVTFGAASNRREDKAGVTGMISPLLDRFGAIYNLDPCTDDTVAYGLTAGWPPVLLAFLKLRPQYIENYQATKDLKKVPSPRSLEMLGQMIQMGITDLEAVSGAVGDAFAQEFCAFYETFGDIPDRDEILLNPDTAPVPADDRPDVMLALMGALAHVAAMDNFDAITQYLERVPPEYAVCCIKNATARDRALCQTGAFNRFMQAHKTIFGLGRATA